MRHSSVGQELHLFGHYRKATRRPLRSRATRPFEFILEPGIVYKMQVDAPRKSILGDAAAQWRQNVRLLVDRFHSAGHRQCPNPRLMRHH